MSVPVGGSWQRLDVHITQLARGDSVGLGAGINGGKSPKRWVGPGPLERRALSFQMSLLIDGWSDALGLDQLPTFIGQVENKTVTAGRTAVLTCTVKDLATSQFSWILPMCYVFCSTYYLFFLNCQITSHSSCPLKMTLSNHTFFNDPWKEKVSLSY